MGDRADFLPHAAAAASPPASLLSARYAAIRAQTLALAAPLSEADAQAQSMPDASPAKWHLAHVTWFFETFVLERYEPDFRPHHAAYRVLYNSYYNGVGEQFPRPRRGLVTRPSLAEVRAWRRAVDERVLALLDRADADADAEMLALVELGLQHEQQHQELLLTDVLHLLSCNPLAPAYRGAAAGVRRADAAAPPNAAASNAPPRWIDCDGGLVDVGHDGRGFGFDNEGPRHRHWLRPFAIAARPCTQREWRAFVDDGGYADPRWWLAAGWDWVRAEGVTAPLHWRRDGAAWRQFTLDGLVDLEPDAPVCHVSLYEADAYARWRSAHDGLRLRLPTEFEWEHIAARDAAAAIAAGNFVESSALRPRAAPRDGAGAEQWFGDVWEWTSSSYLAYPGFAAWDGAVGEYNGKFMIDQTVLRGGSCATPQGHIRASYRNFFPAGARWQFSGLRLARDEG